MSDTPRTDELLAHSHAGTGPFDSPYDGFTFDAEAHVDMVKFEFMRTLERESALKDQKIASLEKSIWQLSDERMEFKHAAESLQSQLRAAQEALKELTSNPVMKRLKGLLEHHDKLTIGSPEYADKFLLFIPLDPARWGDLRKLIAIAAAQSGDK